MLRDLKHYVEVIKDTVDGKPTGWLRAVCSCENSRHRVWTRDPEKVQAYLTEHLALNFENARDKQKAEQKASVMQ